MSAGALGETAPAAGCFGKLPQRGDFLRRGLDGAFVAAWDGWLQAAMSASRGTLGEAWLDLYLTAPVWRFVVGPDAAGGRAHAGVVAPSADRVGRCYPLTIAAPMPAESEGGDREGVGSGWPDWHERAAARIFEVLDETGKLDPFLDGVRALDGPPPWPAAPGTPLCPPGAPQRPWDFAGLAARGTCGVWWTDGNDAVAPVTVLVPDGMPAPDAYAAFLDGRWTHHGWPPGPEPAAAAGEPAAVAARASMSTDEG